ncbi:GNAT family N-acetyltransferase [Alkalicoccobacillus murimartini]|uniref:GNAT superfamily N-acetyltransferase n=1 Tax=Alkalicoccobacillus murimartini TaxID=171685 RepID=A0ABT9YMH5_9BACI|nr:GNAT family N-acetyltransferase [Alkalicoccobacillus murimartini]MDQ0208839.1 GNAT superfamily N-acetyltransferase [Alkalicoccobacillus murimartini]
MKSRFAEFNDIKQLIRMRWDFTTEYDTSKTNESFNDFEKECQTFLEDALKSDQWFIWVAEDNGKIISHIYIELIQKVPRPGRTTYPFAFMTNVYTIPEYRSKGIGSELLKSINKWIKENHYEFVIVWPSEDSINFYSNNGYVHCTEPMEFHPSY